MKLFLQRHPHSDGILALGVSLTPEGRRPAQEQSCALVQRWQNQIRGAPDAMGEQLGALLREITIGHIAFATALSYLDFRRPDIGWRDFVDPALQRWYEEFAARPAMAQTALSDHSYSLRA